MRRREITNLLVQLYPPLLKRLKSQPTEPILLGLALPLSCKHPRRNLPHWRPRRPVRWLLVPTEVRPQRNPQLKKFCPMQILKGQKKRASQITSRVLLWCGPSNTFAEPAAYSRIANRACCICAQPQTKAIPARPSRWFNSAHELQPANMWKQKNMDQLWGQMSSQERRLAGY